MFSLSPKVATDTYLYIPTLHPLMIGNEFMTPPINLPEDIQEDFETLCRFAIRQKWVEWVDFKQHLKKAAHAIVVTDAKQVIRFASKGFEAMTGYSTEYAKGKKPKFLQGKATENAARDTIRTHIEKKIPVEAIVTNYRKSGEPYLCQIKIFPMFNKSHELVNFIALENEYMK
jgi:PAS domain S-box-containing protein